MTAGPCAAGALTWRWKGKLHLTVAVKATFALVPGGVMTTVAPEELFRAEAHHRDNPARSVRATSDLVPYLLRADVVFTGHAHAPPGQRVTMLPVRLAVFHGHALFDKTLHVHGERKGSEAQPFDKAPMIYERALGGIGSANPLGTSSPSIVDPSDASAVAGFAPISRALPQRKKLLGGLHQRALDEATPELPTEFDWTYYQSAPADQRVDALKGNEWIVLEGLHPELPRLSSRLPSARGHARIYGLDPENPDAPRPAILRPDILRIDGDTGRCSLVMRVVLPVEDERTLARLRIVAGVETETHAIPWPEAPPPLHAAPVEVAEVAERAKNGDDDAETLALDDSDAQGGQPHVGTVALDDALPPASALPFVTANRPSAIPPAPHHAEPEEHPLAGTYALDAETAARVQHRPATPFAEGGPSSSRGAPPSSQAIPGAPWSGVASAPPPDPDAETTRTMQYKFDADMQRALDAAPPEVETPPPPPSQASAPPPPPPKPAEPEKAPERPAKPSWSWAPPPDEPKQVEAPKPAPPRPPPKPAVNKSLYGGFTPKKK